MLKEAEEAGHLKATRQPALAPSLGDAVGTVGTREYGWYVGYQYCINAS